MASKYSASSSNLNSINHLQEDKLLNVVEVKYGEVLDKFGVDKEQALSEYTDKLIAICTKNGVTIEDVTYDGIAVVLKDGQRVMIDFDFIAHDDAFVKILTGNDDYVSGESLNTVFDTINKTPSFFKTNFLASEMKYDTQKTSSYYDGEGTVYLDGHFLKYSQKHTDNMKGTIFHEIAHSFDLGIHPLNTVSDRRRISANALSGSKGFQDILQHETASLYSWTYKSNVNSPNSYYKDQQSIQHLKYGTESFAEAMKITGQMKMFGKDSAYLNVPVFNNNGKIVGTRTVNYDTWAEISPNLAKVAKQVWESGSYEKAKKIMGSVQYDPNLKSKPLTEKDFLERSEFITN